MPASIRLPRSAVALLLLLTPALLVGLLTTVGPLRLDPIAAWGGIGIGHRPGWLPGFVSIDPNMGTTSFALGYRAALDLVSGKLPLWNHYEGLGAPLLGEMQSAALFPPTLLLLLPYGQAIEHAVLQAVAGLGAYLFLRRFGLGRTAALAGGLLFEFNGVFAWLRNAVYNPVAFLPWLLFTIESLFRLARGDVGRRERRWTICLGAMAAALALYAGFPEIVYFYSMLLLAWAIVRAASLPGRAAFRFGVDLLAVAVLAASISAPVLIAFADFLSEAAVGGHQGTEFHDHFLPPHAFLATMLPYVFGPIGAAPQASVAAMWGDIGGYLGVAPLLLAVAGAICSWRSATTWLLVGWIVVAVGASHGVPFLHGMLTALPLVEIAAYCRYLDAGWIIACVILAAMFIDRFDRMQTSERRRVATLAAVTVLSLAALGVFFAREGLADVWQGPPWQARSAFCSLGAGAGLVCLFLLTTRSWPARRVVAGLAVAEAMVLFMLPFVSTPRFAGIDRVLTDFLRENVGFQRFAIATGGGLGPNFGSVFGIPSMNYDDLPVPARTARFVTRRLDATNDGVIFGHNGGVADEAERLAARARFVAALPGYAQAGVHYVLSLDDINIEPAYPHAAGDPIAVTQRPGRPIDIVIDELVPMHRIAAVSVLVGTFGGTATGVIRIRLCQRERCAVGSAPLATAPDNRGLLIALDAPFDVDPASPARLSIVKDGGQHDVALWMRPAPKTGAHFGDGSAPASYLPVVDWIRAEEPRPILRTATTTVYELNDPRPYASAPGCRLTVQTHDRIEARCDAPSRLLRLEVLMRGWSARIDGTDAPLVAVEDTFQGVDLPAGLSIVEFRYAPWGLIASLAIALTTLAACLGVCLAAVGSADRAAGRRRRRFQLSTQFRPVSSRAPNPVVPPRPRA